MSCATLWERVLVEVMAGAEGLRNTSVWHGEPEKGQSGGTSCLKSWVSRSYRRAWSQGRDISELLEASLIAVVRVGPRGMVLLGSCHSHIGQG